MNSLPSLSPLAVLLLLLSPAFGSFLGVLVTRLPRGKDVIRARSCCAECGHLLGLRDLVPLLSYLALDGKCRHCAAPIPPLLPLIEAASVALALLLVWQGTSDLQMLLGMGFLGCLLVLALIDQKYFRLPDPLTGALFVLGIGLALAEPNRPWLDGAIGALAGGGAFWAIRITYRALRHREGLGMGDVKLMAGIGAALGVQALPLVVLIAALAALALALWQALRSGRSLQATTALPFGSYLCLSGGLVWLFNL